jgi:hypothetical protein
LRPWLELAYFGSSIFLVLVALYAAQQVTVLKRDIKTRNERAAKEAAILYSARYAVDFVRQSDLLHDKAKAAGVPTRYDGPIGDFSRSSVPKEFHKMMVDRGQLSYYLAINELEIVAAAFVTGVADEQIGSRIFGASFCANVEFLYDQVCMYRGNSSASRYESIVSLYSIWRPRLRKRELRLAKAILERRISEIEDLAIKPIGTEDV